MISSGRSHERIRLAAFLWVGAVATTLSACGGDPGGPVVNRPDDLVCEWDPQFLADGGVGRDGIPALSDPLFLPAHPRVDEIAYFKPTDRVIAYWSAGEWLVIPLNIMWRHEIVNLPEAIITYCPVTGSALGYARLSTGGAELGVSGLLYQANLVMYDRTSPQESLWPQMYSEARCGPRTGDDLIRVPLIEMPWQDWVALHPESKVLALTPNMFDPTRYFASPYGDDFADPDNADYLGYPLPEDDRRLPKELVLGLPDDGTGAKAFPFLAMEALGERAVFEFEYEGEPAVVLWDAERETAMAYRPIVSGQQTTFSIGPQGFLDAQSATEWAVDGTPIGGTHVGSSRTLRPILDAHLAFWRPWAAFNPGTEIVTGS